MAASQTDRRWVGFLAAIAVMGALVWMVRHRLYGGVPTAGNGLSSTALVPQESSAPPAPVHAVPGQEIFAIDLGIVVEVDFETTGRTVVIRRSQESSGGGSGGDFAISIKTDGTAAAQSCQGGPPLQALLERLSSIKVTRVIGGDEAAALRQRLGSGAATLRIRDRTALDPKEFRVLFPDAPPPRALLLDGPALYETSLPRELFDRLSAGCEALGRSPGRGP